MSYVMIHPDWRVQHMLAAPPLDRFVLQPGAQSGTECTVVPMRHDPAGLVVDDHYLYRGVRNVLATCVGIASGTLDTWVAGPVAWVGLGTDDAGAWVLEPLDGDEVQVILNRCNDIRHMVRGDVPAVLPELATPGVRHYMRGVARWAQQAPAPPLRTLPLEEFLTVLGNTAPNPDGGA